jgi:hypothetical protein
MNRLTLTHLTLFGPNVETASVEFGPGATVVRGPSDTGKSFIVDAVDFMLGAQNLKEIPNATDTPLFSSALELLTELQVGQSAEADDGACQA